MEDLGIHSGVSCRGVHRQPSDGLCLQVQEAKALVRQLCHHQV